jgi:hypothetical protein
MQLYPQQNYLLEYTQKGKCFTCFSCTELVHATTKCYPCLPLLTKKKSSELASLVIVFVII